MPKKRRHPRKQEQPRPSRQPARQVKEREPIIIDGEPYVTAASLANKMITHISPGPSAMERPQAETEPKMETGFSEMQVYGRAASMVNVYSAGQRLAAVSLSRQGNDCGYYTGFRIGRPKPVDWILDGSYPDGLSGVKRHNILHCALGEERTIDERMLELSAAIVLLCSSGEPGEPDCYPPVVCGGIVSATPHIGAMAYRHATDGSRPPVIVAQTHLIETTTCFLAFEAPNLLDGAAILRDRVNLGEEVHAAPGFVDLSMFRTLDSTEERIGALLASAVFLRHDILAAPDLLD